MKKIMILGAGEAQLNLIRTAKELGYYIVTCDMRTGTEAERLSDKYYGTDYMDKEAILDIGKREEIDGVVSNSEPAMLTVAFVSEAMGLPGNSVKSIETLLSKSKFRELQNQVGAYAPKHYVVSTADEAIACAKGMQYPIIIKPAQCSGTRGTARFRNFNERGIVEDFETCKNFSRDGLAIIEEYVEMSCLRVNDADVFVLGDDFLWDGWLWEDRSPDTPMLPMTEIYPMAMPEVVKTQIVDTVNRILRAAGVRHGEYNVETYYTPEGKLFVIEINPRQAGNHIPRLIEQHTGVSLTKLLVSTAVGDMSYYDFLKTYKREHNYVTLQVVFAKEDGIFDRLFIDPEIEKYVKWIDQAIEPGGRVVKGANAGEAVAFVNMQFGDYGTQHRFTDAIEKYIYPVVRQNDE